MHGAKTIKYTSQVATNSMEQRPSSECNYFLG